MTATNIMAGGLFLGGTGSCVGAGMGSWDSGFSSAWITFGGGCDAGFSFDCFGSGNEAEAYALVAVLADAPELLPPLLPLPLPLPPLPTPPLLPELPLDD